MIKVYLPAVLSLMVLSGLSQSRYSVTYEQLKQFEGLYEYTNHTTLKIAASPRDTLLYAVINESKYKLVPANKDLFVNMSGDKVQFFRNKSYAVAGYISGKDSFKLLSKNVFFPKTIWYPRLTTAKNYKYHQPPTYKDGLTTGDIQHSGLDRLII